MATQRRQPGGDDGFATAEFAVALPAVILVVAAMTGLLQAMLIHHRAMHAAGVGARVAARGESPAQVHAAVGRTGPAGASTSIRDSGDLVSVTVRPRVPTAVAWALPDLSAEVVAWRESGFDDGEDSA